MTSYISLSIIFTLAGAAVFFFFTEDGVYPFLFISLLSLLTALYFTYAANKAVKNSLKALENARRELSKKGCRHCRGRTQADFDALKAKVLAYKF